MFYPDEMKERSVEGLQKAIREGLFEQKYIPRNERYIKNMQQDKRILLQHTEMAQDNTVESEIAVRWNMFRKQVVPGDEYRKEDFRQVFPELWEIVKEDFDYDLLYSRAEKDPHVRSNRKRNIHIMSKTFCPHLMHLGTQSRWCNCCF